MAEAAGLGLQLDAGDLATLFGEDQARYLVACSPEGAAAVEAAALLTDVPVLRVGHFGGDVVDLGGDSADLAELSALYRGAFAAAVA